MCTDTNHVGWTKQEFRVDNFDDLDLRARAVSKAELFHAARISKKDAGFGDAAAALDADAEGSWSQFAEHVGTRGTWAGQIEIQALSAALRRDIHVVIGLSGTRVPFETLSWDSGGGWWDTPLVDLSSDEADPIVLYNSDCRRSPFALSHCCDGSTRPARTDRLADDARHDGMARAKVAYVRDMHDAGMPTAEEQVAAYYRLRAILDKMVDLYKGRSGRRKKTDTARTNYIQQHVRLRVRYHSMHARITAVLAMFSVPMLYPHEIKPSPQSNRRVLRQPRQEESRVLQNGDGLAAG